MRKKSKYKPRVLNYDTMGWVKSGLMAVGSVPEAGMTLKVINLAALDCLILGKGTGEDSHSLRQAFVMALCLPRINPKLGVDWVPELKEAKVATFAMHDRGERTGRFLFTGPEMQAVKKGMEIHIQQLEECTVQEMEKAIRLAMTLKDKL